MASGSFAKHAKGTAGVHWVVSQLSLRGYVALPTTRNLKGVDVVAFNEKLSRFAFIQVKSTDKPKGGWPVYTVRKEDGWEEDVRQSLVLGRQFFYVFVSLPSSQQAHPVCYVLPGAVVARMTIDGMRNWLAGNPSRRAARQLCAWQYGGLSPKVVRKYQDKWELLKLDE
jgi:hypothetical protein